jgi:hypothetical protein
MRGEFIAIWPETQREVWERLAAEEVAPLDLFPELYRAFVPALRIQPTAEVLAEITGSAEQSRALFSALTPDHFMGERHLVRCLEEAYDVLEGLAGDTLSNPYFNFLSAFVERYSLRYDIRRPCHLCPTLPGLFASLIRECKEAAALDADLTSLLHAFEEGIRELRAGPTDARIKTCIQRQLNLLEAFGRACSGVTKNTLGAICDEVVTWPHAEVKKAVKSLYQFANDFPGIRHGGTPANALRGIEMRDLVGVSVALAGLTTYLIDFLNAECVYHGGL